VFGIVAMVHLRRSSDGFAARSDALPAIVHPSPAAALMQVNPPQDRRPWSRSRHPGHPLKNRSAADPVIGSGQDGRFS
jgi:hypothetical protein